MDSQVGAAVFSASNQNHIYTTGKGGGVYLWDVRTSACVDRHVDEGAVRGTALASSKSHYAVGSDCGVVNIYSNAAMRGAHVDGEGNNQSEETTIGEFGARTGSRREKPERALLNLTTTIHAMSFNVDGRILAIASRALKNSVRLVHVPSMTVFSNWPSQATNLRRVSCLAFSPGGGYFSAGNDKGEALLFRIRNGYPAF
jgi:U3 small nucleolar RNA-associated protein 18